MFEAYKRLLRDFFSTFFTYFALQIRNGNSDECQTVLDITFICNLCLWKI